MHDIIAIGGSTGSLEALQSICAGLPVDLPAAVFVVVHTAEGSTNLMASILGNVCALSVKTAEDGEPIRSGQVYVAPAGYHLLLAGDGVVLGRGPRENMSRPAVDALFRSVAVRHGTRAIGLVLTGMLDDGAAGLAAIKRCGGIAVVQDPADCRADAMPLAALAACNVDYRAPADRLGALLARLSREPSGAMVPAPPDLLLEVEIAAGRLSDAETMARLATPVALSCPECSGVLSQINDGGRLRFRCQIGHGFTAELLEVEQRRGVDFALGVALRVIEERVTLTGKMAAEARQRGHNASAGNIEARTIEYRGYAEVIRRAVLDHWSD